MCSSFLLTGFSNSVCLYAVNPLTSYKLCLSKPNNTEKQYILTLIQSIKISLQLVGPGLVVKYLSMLLFINFCVSLTSMSAALVYIGYIVPLCKTHSVKVKRHRHIRCIQVFSVCHTFVNCTCL